MKERPESHTDTQLTSQLESSLPPGWPTDVPLPTLEEAEEAVRKVGEMIVQFRKEDKDKRKHPGPVDQLPFDDMGKAAVTI